MIPNGSCVPLDGKKVVIVGASRGIGAACATACAQAGGEVVLLARSPEGLQRRCSEIVESGGAASFELCDVRSTASIDRAFAAIGRIDILVNSAGVNRPQPFTEITEDTYDELFAVNVRGAFFAAQAAVIAMRSSRIRGSIIMISSQMGRVGAPLRTAYCATKHAIEGLTKALAVELGPDGIRVVSIAPTFVRTDMTAAQLDDPLVGPELLRQIPLGRFTTPEEVAEAVVYAAGPAAAMMTGSSLTLDGGWTAR